MGDIGMIKGGGLAWLLWQVGVVVNDVVDHRGISGLGVYRREEGEETVNIMHTNATLFPPPLLSGSPRDRC